MCNTIERQRAHARAQWEMVWLLILESRAAGWLHFLFVCSKEVWLLLPTFQDQLRLQMFSCSYVHKFNYLIKNDLFRLSYVYTTLVCHMYMLEMIIMVNTATNVATYVYTFQYQHYTYTCITLLLMECSNIYMYMYKMYAHT